MSPVTEVVTDGYYSVSKLVALCLPGFPRSPKGWYDLLAREKWECREVQARGGKTGKRREFKPPASVVALIEQRLRGELPPAMPGGAPRAPRVSHAEHTAADPAPSLYTYRGEAPAERPQGVDAALLRLCLGACTLVYGEAFARQPATLQIEHAADLYNQVVRHAAAHKDGVRAGINAFARLETRGLAEQLRLFLQMDLLRPWPNPAQGLPDNTEQPA